MDTRTVAGEGLHEAWRRMVLRCPGHTWSRRGDVITALTGLPVAPFNGVWVAAEDPDPTQVLGAVDALPDDLPWNVQLRPGPPAELQEALAARGLTHTADIPLMVATAEQLAGSEGDLAFSEIVTFDDVGEHLRLLELAFGMPSDLTRRCFPMAMFAADGLSAWLGRADGEVVTTGMHVLVEGSAGIFNIATPEEHRGKGYGGAVTVHAARAALAQDAEIVWLQASPLGEPVYRGLGFETVESWQQWIPTQYVT